MEDINTAIGKSFQILFYYIIISTSSTVTYIYPMAKTFVLKNYKITEINKRMQINSIIHLTYGPKRDEATEVGWSLHYEMFHDWHCSENFGGEKRGNLSI